MDQNPNDPTPAGDSSPPDITPEPTPPPAPEVAAAAEATASAPAPVPPPAAPPPVQTWQTPPEVAGPAPGFKFAPHGGRLVAYILDGIIIAIATTLIFLAITAVAGILAVADADALAGLTVLIALLAAFAVSIGYFPYFWSHGGTTPGMRPFHLRVVRDVDGGPVSGGKAILRLIGLWVAAAVFYIGFIWVFIDDRRRGWQDLIAGTCVVEVQQ